MLMDGSRRSGRRGNLTSFSAMQDLCLIGVSGTSGRHNPVTVAVIRAYAHPISGNDSGG